MRAIYDRRFSGEQDVRHRMWQVLCAGFFQRYVPRTADVLELGAGGCEFINNIDARHKTAVDVNPDLRDAAAPGVRVIVGPCTAVPAVPDASVDVVFASNLFEHLSREDILATVREARRVLRPDGRLLVLQPNIRFCQRDYWMFFDHVTPLDHFSTAEALEIGGFRVTETIVRFLPFTTKGKLPTAPFLVKCYLRVRPAWRLLGQQSFLVAAPAQ